HQLSAFLFQAEDGIRAFHVTGVQTCALPIFFGIEALEAYQAGDLDSAAINAGITLASAANLRLYAQSYRAIRAARAAVIAGEARAEERRVGRVRNARWTLDTRELKMETTCRR